MNWKTKFYFFPAIFGRHLEYPELPKGDMTTPTLGFLLRPYTIIIHREKNYIKKYGVQSLGSRTKPGRKIALTAAISNNQQYKTSGQSNLT